MTSDEGATRPLPGTDDQQPGTAGTEPAVTAPVAKKAATRATTNVAGQSSSSAIKAGSKAVRCPWCVIAMATMARTKVSATGPGRPSACERVRGWMFCVAERTAANWSRRSTSRLA